MLNELPISAREPFGKLRVRTGRVARQVIRRFTARARRIARPLERFEQTTLCFARQPTIGLLAEVRPKPPHGRGIVGREVESDAREVECRDGSRRIARKTFSQELVGLGGARGIAGETGGARESEQVRRGRAMVFAIETRRFGGEKSLAVAPGFG